MRKLSHVIASFSHQTEHVLFDARNSHEKNLAASRYDTRTSFSRKLTRASFLYKFLVRLSSALAEVLLGSFVVRVAVYTEELHRLSSVLK